MLKAEIHVSAFSSIPKVSGGHSSSSSELLNSISPKVLGAGRVKISFRRTYHPKEPASEEKWGMMENNYWLGREICPLLGYGEWGKFEKVIRRSALACEQTGVVVKNHFAQTGKMIEVGKGAKVKRGERNA